METDQANHERSRLHDAKEALRALKATRQQLHEAKRRREEAESGYAAAVAGLQTELPYGELPDVDPFTHLYRTIRAMNEDTTYRYLCDAPRYDGKRFVVSTANVNEYQARFFGPIPHEEMRQHFRAFRDEAKRRGMGIRMYRSSVNYDPDRYSTGVRIALPVELLEGKGEGI